MSKSKYRTFTPEYREEAVQLVIEENRPIAEVARDLGINEGTLGNWVSKYRNDHPVEETLNITERARLKELERENRQLRLERDFLEKSRSLLRERTTVTARYEFIDAEKVNQDTMVTKGRLDPAECLSLVRMCAVLEVSRSGYYEWRDREVSARARRRALVALHVRAAFEAGRGTYGAGRVHAMTSRCDDPAVASASLKLARSIMREEGLFACQPRAYKTTTRNDGTGTGIQDHLGRDFTSDTPGANLVGDITYVRTWQGWLYLATVIDCATRMVIGWSMAEHMRTSLVRDALSMAARNLDLPAGAVFHSDRGTQYTSGEFAKHLKKLDITASMGRTGVCWDNALAESFFGALKNELVHRHVFPTRDRARRAIAEYIEVFYNRRRIHSHLGYKTPHQVLTEYQQNIANAA